MTHPSPFERVAGRLNRRSVVLAALALPLALHRNDVRGQFGQQPAVTGDCRIEPGVELLAEFNLGMPVVEIPDLLPPLDWVRYDNPQIGLTFLYPNTWTAQTLWAEQFSPEGAPRWTGRQPLLPELTTNRIFSPDGTASFEAAVGTLHGALLSPLQAANVADLGVAAASSRLEPFCDYEDRKPLSPAWFRASHIDGSVLVSEGFAIPNPSAMLPSTIVVYYAMTGPRETFESLVREVYLRILFQFMPSGGDQPTPTPEP
jgi:hypothetical protein